MNKECESEVDEVAEEIDEDYPIGANPQNETAGENEGITSCGEDKIDAEIVKEVMVQYGTCVSLGSCQN